MGMMLHQDGSRHQWVPGTYWDLVVTMADATGEVYAGFFSVAGRDVVELPGGVSDGGGERIA